MSSKHTSAGIGDPYWYEWSLGLRYVIAMLRPDSGICSVTLQQTGSKGLDDVVVRMTSGDIRLIQVKHTREGNSLTFGDLVTAGEVGGVPLLSLLANNWKREQEQTEASCRAMLLTNRGAGERRATVQRHGLSIERPPLSEFLPWLRDELTHRAHLSEFVVPQTWQAAWNNEWLPLLDGLNSDAQKLEFLRQLEIKTNELSLEQIKTELITELGSTFAVAPTIAEDLLARLDTKLRTWATSSRGTTEAITAELAYEALCVLADRMVGEHELPPPAPFFPSRIDILKQLESQLTTETSKAIFVTGEPGSGKTAIVSALANRREPIIDLRYHAYRPVTPENQLLPADAGRTATAVALWGDLLIQLRVLARGSLAKLRVPVSIALMSADAMRSEVLRIASALGTKRDRPVVIAVDGIDHAARFGGAVETLLASLVSPSQIPDGIVFLIAGQPPEAYSNYPTWLRAPTPAVARFELPRLQLADTEALVAARYTGSDSHVPSAITRQIHEHCGGHPLATVFAVEEAAACDFEIESTGSRLATRNIAEGIEAYYQTIWSAAGRIHSLTEPTMNRLAACLTLSPMRVTGRLLEDVNPTAPHPAAEWGDVLRMMRPLVVEEDAGWRLLHNDVRVFLQRQLHGEVSIYSDCASRMADVVATGSDERAKCESLQALLGIAGRHRDQVTIFLPEYVLAGYAAGFPIQSLAEQGLIAATALLELNQDWQAAHSLACGLRTLSQLVSASEWRSETEQPRHGPMSVRRAERGVTPLPNWSSDELSGVLRDIQQLIDAGEDERARAAFLRWFGGITPTEVLRSGCPQLKDDDHFADSEAAKMVELLGRVSSATRVQLPVSKKEDELAELGEATYGRGVLAAAQHIVEPRRFFGQLRRLRTFYWHDFHSLLHSLLVARDSIRIRLLLSRLSPDADYGWPLRISCALASALAGPSRRSGKWLTTVLAQRDAAIEAAVTTSAAPESVGDQISTMVSLAVVLGFQEATREPSQIRQDIEDAFRRRNRDSRSDRVISQVLYAGALLGACVRRSASVEGTLPIDPDLIRRVVELLARPIATYPDTPIGYAQVARLLLQGFVDVGERQPQWGDVIAECLLSRLAQHETLGPFLETAWHALRKRGYKSELLDYSERFTGDSGEVWIMPPDDRHDLVARFANLLDGVGDRAKARAIRTRARWGAITYTGHKEYSLDTPLEWFREVAALDAQSWSSFGVRLLAISREASRAGDNRMGWRVKEAVVGAACLDGAPAVSRLLEADGAWLQPESSALRAGLMHRLAKERSSEPDLRAVWAFCTGQLSWQNHDDQMGIAMVRDQLLEAANRASISGLNEYLHASAPAEAGARTEDEERTDSPDHSELDLLSPIDATRFSIAGTKVDWQTVEHIIKRVKRERPSDADQCAELIWNALQRAEEHWSWTFDGRWRVYNELFPLLGADQRWGAVLHLIRDNAQETPRHRVYALAENLDGLCLFNATQTGLTALAEGLNRSLSMHECWATGSGRIRAIDTAMLPSARSSLKWSSLFLELLFKLLDSDHNAYQVAALCGIYRLLRSEPTLLDEVTSLVAKASRETLRRFLFIAERIATLPNSKPFAEWLESLIDSTALDTALAAWLALRARERSTGEVLRDWPQPAQGAGQTVIPVARSLIVRPPISRGSVSVVGRASQRLLDQLGAVCGGRLADVEALFADAIRSESPPEPPKRRGRERDVSDMVSSLDPEVERLMDILHVQERRGRFSGIATIRLAQALVPAADPYLLVESPAPTNGPWPIDEGLETAMRSRPELEAELATLARVGLTASHHVIAAVVKTYSRTFDVVAHLNHRSALSFSGPDQCPIVLNGRSSFAFSMGDIASNKGARDQEWLTQEVGGLIPLAGGCLDLFPGRLWPRFGWTPLPENPLEWWRAGRKVCWHERLHGPIRRTYGGDFLYRQPILSRWVCRVDEWQEVSKQLPAPPERRFRVEIDRVPER
jgi:hypothetical protein